MFLDGELREIALAKEALCTRIDLRRQVMRLEAGSAVSGLKRRLGIIGLGLGLGLHVYEFYRLWRSRRAVRG